MINDVLVNSFSGLLSIPRNNFFLLLLEYNDAMLCFACCVYDLKGICSETQENVISRKINVFDVEYERRTGYGKYKNLLYPQISLYFK